MSLTYYKDLTFHFYAEYSGTPGVWHNAQLSSQDTVKVCFTPPAGCGQLIVEEIGKAKKSIYVQAYSLTSAIIVDGLIRAHSSGVDVNVLVDKSNLKDSFSKMKNLKKAGIKVAVDHVVGIAHNKVMIIDRKRVITGSFNFSHAADYKNAENVVLIDNSTMASAFLESWFTRHSNALL
ncbi:PLD-like domain-containing protein [Ditylenchus destructor]|uniref:Mitochondrial cardiolipin hydrolase n=1 Tax=Ditylenchus destructor TaxID=166010 RepID=A0AAD4NNE8_9BILA|nr:PLD-like domain-containing protein [Ditylenchus destructor]